MISGMVSFPFGRGSPSLHDKTLMLAPFHRAYFIFLSHKIVLVLSGMAAVPAHLADGYASVL